MPEGRPPESLRALIIKASALLGDAVFIAAFTAIGSFSGNSRLSTWLQ
jgi:hypothetical protein